jgi:MFS family permease
MDDNDRALTAFTMLGHGTFHSYELVIPVFVAIWLDVFPVTSATLGAIVGGSYALVGLGAIPSGMLADRFSAKRVILACLLGMGAAFGLVGLAPNLLVLAAGLLLWGAAASLYHPAALALISRGTKERGTAFAYHGIAGNIGVASGPLLAAVLLLTLEWRTVAFLLILPALLAALLGLRLEFDETAGSDRRSDDAGESQSTADSAGQDTSNQSVGQPQTLPEFLADSRRLFTGGFVLVFAIGMLYGVYYRGLFTFLPDVLAESSVMQSGTAVTEGVEPSQYVYSGLLLLGAVGQYTGGKLVERVPVESALAGTYLCLSVIALVFTAVMESSLGPLLVVAGLVGFLVFMVAPINQEAIASYSVPSMRGLSFGYTYTAIFGLGALGATMAGFILSRGTPQMLFVVLSGIAASTVTIALILLTHTERN